MLLTQQVVLPALDPDKRHTLVWRRVGDVPTERVRFEHKAGLFVDGAPSMAEHEPNSGVGIGRESISQWLSCLANARLAGFYIRWQYLVGARSQLETRRV